MHLIVHGEFTGQKKNYRKGEGDGGASRRSGLPPLLKKGNGKINFAKVKSVAR